MKISLLFCILAGLCSFAAAEKTVYIPNSIKNMDLNSSSSQWCHARTRESDNIVVFWEKGYGNDPSTATGSYHVDMTTLLADAERAYNHYIDTLGFAVRGESLTDKYKLIIFLMYSSDWVANGSGEDEVVQSLRVSAPAAKVNNVVAHEIGHCFQYISGCDTDGGFRYGLGENGEGGNGFWEQCAQWMSFKVYPEKQFVENDFRNYLANQHKHILHETPRYANYFIQDYWTWKHDITFTGKLWRESKRPEDPVEAYIRINDLSQSEFNDEIFEQAARLTTWDIPHLSSYGKKYIDSRAQVKMQHTSDDYWLVDRTVCPENYGYNSIKLVAPSRATTVSATLKGNAGANGFRSLNKDKGGWRFGFVALLDDGSRVYSDMAAAEVKDGTNPEESLSFSCPDNCAKLWFVVSGAPQEHWKHAWDDNDNNDEQWPYMVSFTNTNLFGEIVGIAATPKLYHAPQISVSVTGNTVLLSERTEWTVTSLAGRKLIAGYGNVIDLGRLSGGAYFVSCANLQYRIVRR